MAAQTAFNVKGKTAIVTGAGSGINYCFAKLLLEHGCNVLIADLSLRPEAQALIDTYTSSPRAVFQETDVTDWAALEHMFAVAAQAFGDIDIVCPGAGIYDPPWSNFWHPPGSPTSRDQQNGGRYATLDINVTHPIRCTQLAISAFLASQKATQQKSPKRVLIVSSIAGQNSNLHTPIYVAAKHAMNGFVRSLAALEQQLGIRVNGVAPGLVRTPLWTEHPEKLQFVAGADEWASPKEVADAMLRCLVDVNLPGGSILEVGKEQTRLVGALMDPGPSGRGHTVSRLEEANGEVFERLGSGEWGRAKL
ncbi:NAD(P)-binding protein [Didymella exigua CBS 183.55]|uniref:NAD(P)-binding protein n=1 Tax=Didymella exigua CBS 183.55 TaxID=1150837 RepID=A0A6A5RWG3_9PLEO|nr:NAD(P)-binding protein [Didymella exigua CBS 183.55]KAF1931923.1 NAD(P)-binding protein [Didymella exigua CBS 183.55]